MKWMDARSAIAGLAAVATIVCACLAVNELDKQEAAILEAEELAQQIEIKPVVSVQIAEKPVSEPKPVAMPEIVLIYDIPLDADLQLFIIGECEKVNIDPAIVMAMAFCESSYNVDAIGDGGKSFGLLQVQPYWHQERMDKLGITDLFDPYQNVTVALDYLAEQLARYDGDMAKALVAYNAGHYKGTVTTYANNVLASSETLTEGMIPA